MSYYPRTVPLVWRKRDMTSTARDALKNLVPSFEPDVTIFVLGFALNSSAEMNRSGHEERVTEDAICFPASDQGIGPYDRIVHPRFGEFEVIGQPGDWDDNSLGFSPGLVQCRLRKVTG